MRMRKAFASKGDDTTLSRWVKTGPPLAEQLTLLHSPRAIDPRRGRRWYTEQGVSKFTRKGVKHPETLKHVLVSGHSNAKIGRDVRKGKLRGYWIYTLSLEERATCPRSCAHWTTCYGNNMPYAQRVSHADYRALTSAIERDIRRLLSVRGRRGILVRLHALGDFFAPAYVAFWRSMLALHSRLAVYGYTARSPDEPIGKAIAEAKRLYGDRFAVRWSNGGKPRDCTVTIRAVDEAVNSIVCPEQRGLTAACATCALCWTTEKNIAFIEH